MQGKALVVNPAVIQPSAPPTIARRNGEDSCGTCDPTLEKSKKTPVPGRTRDTHRIHGIHGRTDHTDEPHNHPKFQTQRHSSTGPHDHATADTGRLWKETKRAAGVHGQSVRQVSRYGPTTRVHGVAHLSTAAALPIFHLNAIMLEAWPRADEHGSKVEASNAARRARQPRARRQLRVKSSQVKSIREHFR